MLTQIESTDSSYFDTTKTTFNPQTNYVYILNW